MTYWPCQGWAAVAASVRGQVAPVGPGSPSIAAASPPPRPFPPAPHAGWAVAVGCHNGGHVAQAAAAAAAAARCSASPAG